MAGCCVLFTYILLIPTYGDTAGRGCILTGQRWGKWASFTAVGSNLCLGPIYPKWISLVWVASVCQSRTKSPLSRKRHCLLGPWVEPVAHNLLSHQLVRKRFIFPIFSKVPLGKPWNCMQENELSPRNADWEVKTSAQWVFLSTLLSSWMLKSLEE